MRLLKHAMAVLGTATMVVVLMAVVAPKTTHSLAAALVQVVPGTTTHVGQNESRLVSLLCAGRDVFSVNPCQEIDPEGKVSNTSYVVPSGFTLILTDYEWQVVVTSPVCGTAGDLTTDQLHNAKTGDPYATVLSIADPIGHSYGHEHYSTGIRVGSGVMLDDFQGNENHCGFAYVQGYLVPND
jgi:hypothetical protein